MRGPARCSSQESGAAARAPMALQMQPPNKSSPPRGTQDVRAPVGRCRLLCCYERHCCRLLPPRLNKRRKGKRHGTRHDCISTRPPDAPSQSRLGALGALGNRRKSHANDQDDIAWRGCLAGHSRLEPGSRDPETKNPFLASKGCLPCLPSTKPKQAAAATDLNHPHGPPTFNIARRCQPSRLNHARLPSWATLNESHNLHRRATSIQVLPCDSVLSRRCETCADSPDPTTAERKKKPRFKSRQAR